MTIDVRNKSFRALILMVFLALLGGGLFVLSMNAQLTLASPEAVTGSKSVGSDVVLPGSDAEYAIVVNNDTGVNGASFKVYDTLDDQLTFDPASLVTDPFGQAIWDYDGQYITVTLPSVDAGDVITIHFDAELDIAATAGDIISNTAVISSAMAMAEPLTTGVAAFTVGEPPAMQIFDPDNDELITDPQGAVKEISGRVWIQDEGVFPSPTVLNPVSSFNTLVTLSWSYVPEAEYYIIEEATDDSFDNSVQTLISTAEAGNPPQKTFTTTTGDHYYRIASLLNYEGTPHPSRWSNVESVTITSTNAEPTDGAVSIMMDTGIDAGEMVTVQVSLDEGANWNAADVSLDGSGNWWNWTYDWVLPIGDNVEKSIVARAAYDGSDEYTEDSITIVLKNSTRYLYVPMVSVDWPPYPETPTIDATDPGDGNDYNVTWDYPYTHPAATGFELQEATNAAFSEGLGTWSYSSSTTSKSFTDKADDVYYYRVRATNSYGISDWSDTISVTVQTYINRNYTFESGKEGWAIVRTDELNDPGQIGEPVAQNGYLYHLVVGKGDYSIISPMEEAPPEPYEITANVKIVVGETIGGSYYSWLNGMTYGIIFGGADGTPCPAGRGNEYSGCFSEYYRLLVTFDANSGGFLWQLKRIDYHNADNAGQGTSLIDWRGVGGSYDGLGFNTWRIEVTDDASDNIKVYFNDSLVGTATDHEYIDNRYFGTFMASTKELGGVGTKWSWFNVEKME